MVRIAVTGGIACGKSKVGSFLAGAGVAVCDADDLARDLMRKGADIHRRMVAEFGEVILDAEGAINRPVLGSQVFFDAGKRGRLNSIVHPAVKVAWESWIAGIAPGVDAAVVIVPLLYEVNEGENWDAVVCVACEREDQVKRLRGRGLDDSEIEARLAAQMPVSEKMERADYVIFNSGSLEMLRKQTVEALRLLMEKHDTRKRKR